MILLEMIVGNTPLDIYCDKKHITDDNEVDTEILLKGNVLNVLSYNCTIVISISFY